MLQLLQRNSVRLSRLSHYEFKLARLQQSPNLQIYRKSSSGQALRSILNDKHYAIINEERNLLAELHSALSSLEVSKAELDLVSDTRSRIDDLFMILVVGEFNAGKSTFINSLLGAEYLRTGVLPTTDKIYLLRIQNETSQHGGAGSTAAKSTSAVWKQSEDILMDEIEERMVPSHWLRNVALVDTPGTNALLSRHDEMTQQIVPKADMVLFVTSAERPMSDSESRFLERISNWGKKIVVVLNKMDVLQSDSDRVQVLDYVRSHVSTKLRRPGSEPVPLFPVSSKKALQAKLRLDEGDTAGLSASPEWTSSGLEPLSNYLQGALGSNAVVASKLNNPLQVCDRLVSAQLQALVTRKESLVADVRTVELLQESMRSFEGDLQRDVKFAQTQIQSMFTQHKTDIAACLEEHVAAASLLSVLNMSAVEEDLRKAAKLELQGPLDDTIMDVSGLVATRSRAQAAAVVQYVSARHEANPRARAFMGTGGAFLHAAPGEQFDKNARDLRTRLQRDCSLLFDKNEAAHENGIRDAVRSIRMAYMQVFGLQVSAAAGATALAMQAVDWPIGVIAVCCPLALSVIALPATRKNISKKFLVRAEVLQKALDGTLTSTLTTQLRTVSEHITSSVLPFERFVSYESRTTNEMMTRMQALREKARELRSRTESSTST